MNHTGKAHWKGYVLGISPDRFDLWPTLHHQRDVSDVSEQSPDSMQQHCMAKLHGLFVRTRIVRGTWSPVGHASAEWTHTLCIHCTLLFTFVLFSHCICGTRRKWKHSLLSYKRSFQTQLSHVADVYERERPHQVFLKSHIHMNWSPKWFVSPETAVNHCNERTLFPLNSK